MEAGGIVLSAGTASEPVGSTGSPDAGRVPAKDTEVGCIKSLELWVSGKDWQDSKNTSRQQQSSFMGIGFQIK
jgi:hypothetical protein